MRVEADLVDGAGVRVVERHHVLAAEATEDEAGAAAAFASAGAAAVAAGVLFAAGATGPLPPIKTTVVGAPPFAPAPTTAAFLSMIFWVARPRLGTRFHASASPVLDVDGAGR